MYRRFPRYPDDADYQTNAPSYYDDLARKEHLIKLLAKRIWEYDEILNLTLKEIEEKLTDYIEQNEKLLSEMLEKWDKRIDGLDEEMALIFVEWLNDGTLEEIINHKVLGNKADKSYVDNLNNEIKTQFIETNTNLNNRGVNVLSPPKGYEPCVGDGVTDDTQALQNIINDFNHIIIPSNHIYLIKDTLKTGNKNKYITGTVIPTGHNSFNERNAIIKYDGEMDNKKAVICIGNGEVGDEPTNASSNITFENLEIDCNNKAGIGVYGTYLTNETTINEVISRNSLEYGMFFAKSWYAKFSNLTTVDNMGKGLSFGIPLEFQNNEKIKWDSSSSLAMNNTQIKNIRSIRSGRYFSVNNPNIFSIEEERYRTKGFGIGLGEGNMFNVDTFTSEGSGGVNLYVYTNFQPVKSIKNGYLEQSMVKSGISDKDKTNILIEHVSNTGYMYTIENIFMKYESGGIHFTGKDRKVKLINVYQPRFLKSLDGLSEDILYSIVLKENVYMETGYYNTLEEHAANIEYYTEVNVNKSFNINIPRYPLGINYIYARLSTEESIQPTTALVFLNEEKRTRTSYNYPSLKHDEWTLIRKQSTSYTSLIRGGDLNDNDTVIDFKIVSFKTSVY